MIRVLVVDDSPTMRELLTRLLDADGRFQVAGVACDGEEAAQLARQTQPDVITMDIHMPRLDGVAATRRIMSETPTPIVVLAASVHRSEVNLAFEALQAGAASVVDKPPGPKDPNHARATAALLKTIELMSAVKVVRRRPGQAQEPILHLPLASRSPGIEGPAAAIAIAASTGGPQAIQSILKVLGDVSVPILIVQHIGHGFASGMAAWLTATCPQTVKLGEQDEVPRPGSVYLAPDDRHLLVTSRGSLTLSKAPAQGGFRPSANVLFESAAGHYGKRAIGVLLTGMGDDGAAGLLKLHAAGALTIAQDEASSIVFGMPRAAVEAGAATEVLPLQAIAPRLTSLLALGGA